MEAGADEPLFGWFDSAGVGGLGELIAPLLMVALVVPVFVVARC